MSGTKTVADLAALVDQTLLSPKVGFAEASAWCSRNADRGFATLCVAPTTVPLALGALEGTATRVCSVVGFPLGYTTSEAKAEEAARLVRVGCAEIDMVVHIGALLEGSESYVRDDIAAVVGAVLGASEEALVKVILETGYLGDEHIVSGCRLAEAAGATFVKTSTGFGPRGASTHDVELMRATVGDRLGVKAAGGIRDLETALEMIHAGASRLGTSSGLEILDQLTARSG